MTPHELEEAGEEAVERLHAPILQESKVRRTVAKMLRAHLAGYDQQQQALGGNAAATAAAACEANEAKEGEHVPAPSGPSGEAQAAEAVARRLVAFEKRLLSAQLQLLEADV